MLLRSAPDGVSLLQYTHVHIQVPTRYQTGIVSIGQSVALGLGLPVPMQSHHQTGSTPLKPPCEQLLECWIVRAAAVEAADISRPQRNARETHVQARRQLIPERAPRRGDVAAPDQHPISLTPSPCTSQQIRNVRLAFCLHPS